MTQTETEHTGARRRRQDSTHRTVRINLRLSAAEAAAVTAAAAAAGLTPAGYAAIAATAAANVAATPHLDELRGAVGELVAARTAVTRIGTNLNQAVAGFNATGTPPPWLETIAVLCGRTVAGVDDAIAALRRALPR